MDPSAGRLGGPALAALVLGAVATSAVADTAPAARFIADASDGVTTQCAPGPSPCFIPGDDSPLPQAVDFSDSGFDVEGPFMGSADAHITVGPTIGGLGAVVDASFARTPGQPQAEALARFSVGVEAIVPNAPDVPVPRGRDQPSAPAITISAMRSSS